MKRNIQQMHIGTNNIVVFDTLPEQDELTLKNESVTVDGLTFCT